MLRKSITALFLATCALALTGTAGAAASAASSGPVGPAGELKVSVNGPANCNCTDLKTNLSVCHSEEVKVTIGSTVVQASTGQSTSSCATAKDVPEGVCVYYQYNFTCEKVYGVFSSYWKCEFDSAGIKRRAATDTDC